MSPTRSVLPILVLLLRAPGLAAEGQPPPPDAAAQTPASGPYTIDLATTLRLAGAKSLDIKVAEERLRAAQADATNAATQFLPWFTAAASARGHGGLTQDVLGNIVEADKHSYAAGGAITLQVDVGDALYRTLAARQTRRAAEEGLLAQRQETLVRAAQAYFDLLVAQAGVEVAASALDISRDYESQMHRAVDAGIALKGDEVRVKVQSQRNLLALQQAKEQQGLVAARLAEALRLGPGVELTARNQELAPLSLVTAVEPIEALVAEALDARPELRASSALLRAAEETEKGARYGPLVPTLIGQVAVGTIGGGRDNFPSTSGGARDYLAFVGWRIGPGGLFDFGRVHATEARRGEAQWNLEKLKDGIVRQILEARTRVVSQQEQIETAREALAAAELGLELARGRRQFEVAVVLENILAEQDETRARQDYVRAVGEYDKAQYELVRALGRLGQEPPAGAGAAPPVR